MVFTIICIEGVNVGRKKNRLGLLELSMWEAVSDSDDNSRWKVKSKDLVETKPTLLCKLEDIQFAENDEEHRCHSSVLKNVQRNNQLRCMRSLIYTTT